MSRDSVVQPSGAGAWPVLARLALDEGTTDHPHLRSIMRPTVPLHNLSDVVHALCAVHALRPDMIEAALGHTAEPTTRAWLATAVDGFAVERSYLAHLVAAAGPLPSTPGQAACEQTFVMQRHTFGMLARSARTGCAIGAVAALVMEWHGYRPMLDRAAERFHVAVLPCAMPSTVSTENAIHGLVAIPSVERAAAFGAQQLLLQHRGLWDLLESRAAARDAA